MSTIGSPTLVLNADFRPLSYYPLSLCSWQDAIKAVFLERVTIIENYDKDDVDETEYYKNFNIALNNCKELSDIHSVGFFVGEEDKDVGVDLYTL